MADDFLQAADAYFAEIFANLLGQEREEVHDVVGTTFEMLAKLGILRCHTHRAGIGIALAHHDTAKHNQRQRAKRELIGSQHSHDNDILGRFQLAVGLQAYLIAQTVHHERLLRLGKSNLWRDASETHGTGRAGTRTTLGAADDDEVGFRLCHACGNRSYATLGDEFHADGSGGVDILQVEDELCQVLNTVDVVMRRRRDERDARDGVARLGNDFVHLEAGQLSALARLGSLCHLDLYFLGIH